MDITTVIWPNGLSLNIKTFAAASIFGQEGGVLRYELMVTKLGNLYPQTVQV